MQCGYVIFPQANVESEPSPLPDVERMQRELDLVELAGELGFDEFWVTEHHFGDYNLAPSPLQLLSYVAGRFPAASVGTMVIVLPWNDPLRVVEQVVFLDYLSQGRLLVGFGKGDARREFTAFGVDLASARERFDENLAVVLDTLESGLLERDGLPAVEVRPRPRGSFSGRLYMAAGSPASLERAADSGLGLLRIGLRSWDEVAEQVRSHRARFVAANGHEPPATVTLTYGFVDRDPERARELGMGYARAYRLSAVEHYELGSDAVTELEAFAEAQLWGTPAQVVEKAAYLAEATRTGHLAYAFRYAGVPYEEAISSMRLFASEVAPRLREIPLP
jgi:alkanesulfonate monooxygenase SsuD/methylene tetrahydromethanopterin reductase-like flavin-dependent oxidoreductase (luciferase family)